MNLRLIITFAFIAALVVSGCGADKKDTPQIDTKSNIEPPVTAIERDSLFYGITADDSTTVYDLTVKQYAVEFEKMGDDYFVYSINTVDQQDDYFWVYAVNDTMGSVAANKRRIGPDDRVVWHYRLVTR